MKKAVMPFWLILIGAMMICGCDRIAMSKQKQTPSPVPQPEVTKPPEPVDRILLKNGGMIEGTIVQETSGFVRIKWQGGIVGFERAEIESIEHAVIGGAGNGVKDGVYVPEFQTEAQKNLNLWPEGAKHRLFLRTSDLIGGEILEKTDTAFRVRQTLEGGGAITVEVPLSRVEFIELWKPKPGSKDSFAPLEAQFSGMLYQESGYYHILTSEKNPLELKSYTKALNQFYHEFLIYYFNLIDRTVEPEPLEVVVFGTRQEFDQYLKSLGYQLKSTPIGFYDYAVKKLYFYNAFTDVGIQKGVLVNQMFQDKMTKMSAEIAAQYGAQGQNMQGQIERMMDNSKRNEFQLSAEARNRTHGAIRHESTHQLCQAFAITPFERYQGGWLVEGMAVYSETDPIGEIHQERLMQLRYELEKKDLMPLEYLINFGRGIDFHKLDALYANIAYAESWAFVYFLMRQGYQRQFFDYVRDLKQQDAAFDAQADRVLLEKHLARGLKELETEFFPFVKKLTEEETDEETYQQYRMRIIKSL